MRSAILRSIAGLVLAAATLAFQVDGRKAQTTPPAPEKQKTSKPLAGYSVIVVEPFIVENSQATKDFPAGGAAFVFFLERQASEQRDWQTLLQRYVTRVPYPLRCWQRVGLLLFAVLLPSVRS